MATYRPLLPNETRDGLRLALDRGECGRAALERQIDHLLAYAAAANLGIDRQWGAFKDGRLVAACLSVLSPGHSCMLFLPNAATGHEAASVLVGLLHHVVADAAARNVKLLQAMVPQGSTWEESVLSQAGFTFLAELIYMQREAAALFSLSPPALRLNWVTYDDRRHELFASTVAATYEGSMDCPGLSGLRTVEDIMASHRAAGEFDARCWFVAMDGDLPVGALLLNRVPARSALDVVYMGLVLQYRQRKLGCVFLHHAVRVARDRGCELVTLAVDAANAPAVHLYHKCGFLETSRRRAWIVAPRRCSPPEFASRIP